MQSIGERLEEARKRKGISIREAAESTKIRGDYLHKFENNQYDIKLPEIYVRGFLRTYANFLKLPGEKIINDYNALGLGEAKPRGLNRELYGRMDLSVSTGKPEKGSKERPAEEGLPNEAATEQKARNPATFVPPTTTGITLDKSMLWRIGAIAGGALLLIFGLVWLLTSGGNERPAASTPASLAAPAETWVRPQAGEASLALVAKGRAEVTVVTKDEGTLLFKGVLNAGERRAIPRRGAIRIMANPTTAVEIEIAGKNWPLPTSESAEIRAP